MHPKIPSVADGKQFIFDDERIFLIEYPFFVNFLPFFADSRKQ